ncbi:hypothetical protein [Thermodesulforhabdus norvegica]|uniref:Uncharacterized protein n=1 Tax=Thermodesulforhabdus norvegica TaxID=39841 RepID=A0A1I4SHH1_9BACT|nr:hypothetical protein [Thermodesulforhabdus norvegica]SFM63925.1 hypothetical protein SAMN05660836_00968 [Thermodesulforhabdus norvegica]
MKLSRDVVGIPVIVTVALMGVMILISLGILADRAIRNAVIEQFNGQQMILADVATKSIAEKFSRLTQQLSPSTNPVGEREDLKSWGVLEVALLDCATGSFQVRSPSLELRSGPATPPGRHGSM